MSKIEKGRVSFYVQILERMIDEYEAYNKELSYFITMTWILTDYHKYIHNKHNLTYLWADHPISIDIIEIADKKDKDAIKFISLVNKFSKLETPSEFKEHSCDEYRSFVENLGMLNQ